MGPKSDVAEAGSGSDAADQHGRQPDMSSHDHSLGRRPSNTCMATSWLYESFLRTNDRIERIAVGGPRSGVGILGLGLLEHHINMLPTMQSARDAAPVFDHSVAAGPRYLGWRQKVATWPLSPQEAMNNRKYAV